MDKFLKNDNFISISKTKDGKYCIEAFDIENGLEYYFGLDWKAVYELLDVFDFGK